MGVGSSNGPKKDPPITAKELKNLLDIAQKRCTLSRNKRVDKIKRVKNEIVDCLKKNNMDLAMAKTDNLLKDEDYITVYDLLNPIIEIVKEKCIYIVKNNECPVDLRTQLDSIIFSATRVEIDELMKFRDKIKQKYGEAYIIKADKNEDKFVNQNIAEKLKVNVFPQEVLKYRLKQLCIEKKLNINLGDVVPGDGVFVDADMDKNPYESMRQTNLPTQSFVQRNSGNINQGPFNNNFGQYPPNQGGFQDGFPRESQFNNNNQGQSKSGFGMNNNQGNQGGAPWDNNQNNNQGNQGGAPWDNNQNNNQGNQGGAPWDNNQNNSQGGFSQSSYFNNNINNSNNINNNNSINNNNINNSKNNNNNIPPPNDIPQNNQVNQNVDDEAIFGKTLNETVPISEKSESQEQSKISTNNNNNIEFNPYADNIPPGENKSAMPPKSNTDDIFGSETVKTVTMSTNNAPGNFDITFGKNNKNFAELPREQTMKNSIANPNNKENPFEGGNPFEGSTIELKDQKSSVLKKSGQNDNPFDVDTVPVVELNKMKISSTGTDPLGQSSKMKDDPLGGPTLSAEEIENMNVKGSNNDGFPSA